MIDALMVSKTAEGDIVFVEFDELGLDDDVKALSNLFNQADALISDDDVHEFAAGSSPTVQPHCSSSSTRGRDRCATRSWPRGASWR